MKMLMKRNNQRSGYLVLATLLIILLGGAYCLLAIAADPVNPRADFWRLVRTEFPAIPRFLRRDIRC